MLGVCMRERTCFASLVWAHSRRNKALYSTPPWHHKRGLACNFGSSSAEYRVLSVLCINPLSVGMLTPNPQLPPHPYYPSFPSHPAFHMWPVHSRPAPAALGDPPGMQGTRVDVIASICDLLLHLQGFSIRVSASEAWAHPSASPRQPHNLDSRPHPPRNC